MFLAAKTEEQMDRISEGDELMKEVTDKVKVLNLDPEIARELVIEDEDRLIRNTLLEVGEAKGIEIGVEQGRNDAIRETALNMLKKKMDIDTISEITGLSTSDIEKLKIEDN